MDNPYIEGTLKSIDKEKKKKNELQIKADAGNVDAVISDILGKV